MFTHAKTWMIEENLIKHQHHWRKVCTFTCISKILLMLIKISSMLKNCLFPIHQPGEGKNGPLPRMGRSFFFFFCNLCLKIYTTKIFKKISSWYIKNVTLYIFIFNFCLIFMLIHCNLIMMIDINQNPVLSPHTNKINISIFSPIFRLTVSFADPLWFAMYYHWGSYKRCDYKLGFN